MMKRLRFTLIACAIVFTLSVNTVKAQNYKTGLGMRIDAGDGNTGVGFNVKHFFTRKAPISVNLMIQPIIPATGNSTRRRIRLLSRPSSTVGLPKER